MAGACYMSWPAHKYPIIGLDSPRVNSGRDRHSMHSRPCAQSRPDVRSASELCRRGRLHHQGETRDPSRPPLLPPPCRRVAAPPRVVRRNKPRRCLAGNPHTSVRPLPGTEIAPAPPDTRPATFDHAAGRSAIDDRSLSWRRSFRLLARYRRYAMALEAANEYRTFLRRVSRCRFLKYEVRLDHDLFGGETGLYVFFSGKIRKGDE